MVNNDCPFHRVEREGGRERERGCLNDSLCCSLSLDLASLCDLTLSYNHNIIPSEVGRLYA